LSIAWSLTLVTVIQLVRLRASFFVGSWSQAAAGRAGGVVAGFVVADVALDAFHGGEYRAGLVVGCVSDADGHDFLAPQSPGPLLAQADGPGR
jgi:hypothetical protein